MKVKLNNLYTEADEPIDTYEKLRGQPLTPENDLAALISELERELPRTQEKLDSKN